PLYEMHHSMDMLKVKNEEHGGRYMASCEHATPGQEIRTGPFSIRFHHVSHSIPDGCAVAIDLPTGILLHSGDFKLDNTPIDGRVTDLQGIAEEASRGVHLFLSDSTNAEDPGATGSERSVGPVLRDIVRDAHRLVVIACFASHIHRIPQVANAAIASGRKVAFLGRSMHHSEQAARSLR